MINWSLSRILVALGFSVLAIQCTGNRSEKLKFTQYFNKGEQLYATHCSNCHQKDGSGLGQLYPPIKNSDYMKNRQDVVCLIKFGKKGPMIVNGQEFNQEMRGIPALSNLEIAEITTYIYNAWSTNEEIIDVRDVSVMIDSCGVR